MKVQKELEERCQRRSNDSKVAANNAASSPGINNSALVSTSRPVSGNNNLNGAPDGGDNCDKVVFENNYKIVKGEKDDGVEVKVENNDASHFESNNAVGQNNGNFKNILNNIVEYNHNNQLNTIKKEYINGAEGESVNGEIFMGYFAFKLYHSDMYNLLFSTAKITTTDNSNDN